MRNEIEKVLDEVWGSMRYDSEEATDKILSLLEGRLKKEKNIMETSSPNIQNFLMGWNACRQAMLDNLKEKGE